MSLKHRHTYEATVYKRCYNSALSSSKGRWMYLFWHVYVLWLGYPLQWPRYATFRLNFFYIMTSQRNNTMRIRRRATLEYVKRIDATRYIAPWICHTIRHIRGKDVLPLRKVWYFFLFSRQTLQQTNATILPQHEQFVTLARKVPSSCL